jgi:hypothetical protein
MLYYMAFGSSICLHQKDEWSFLTYRGADENQTGHSHATGCGGYRRGSLEMLSSLNAPLMSQHTRLVDGYLTQS